MKQLIGDMQEFIHECATLKDTPAGQALTADDPAGFLDVVIDRAKPLLARIKRLSDADAVNE